MVEEVKEIKIEVPKSDADLVRETREKLKAENDLMEAEKLRAEKLRAEQIIGGRSHGLPAPEPKPETPREYKERIMRGG